MSLRNPPDLVTVRMMSNRRDTVNMYLDDRKTSFISDYRGDSGAWTVEVPRHRNGMTLQVVNEKTKEVDYR